MIFFDLALGLGLAATRNAFTTCFGSSASTRDTTACCFTFTKLLKIIGRQTAHDDGDVARALTNASGATASTWAPALQRRPFVCETGRDKQFVGGDLVVVLGVGDCRLEALENNASNVTFGQFEHLKCSRYRKSANEIEDLTGLVRR